MRARGAAVAALILAATVVTAIASLTFLAPPVMADSQVQPQVARGGGAPLERGFRVVEGSSLVGTVFPRVSLLEVYAASLDGWTAILELNGDPVEVFNDYLNQATTVGFEAAGTCNLQVEETASTVPQPAQRRAKEVRCSGSGYVVDGSWTIELVSIELRRSPSEAPYESHVVLRYSRFAPGTYARQVQFGEPQVPTEHLVDPGPRPKASSPPATGEPIIHDDFKKPFKVVRGTQALTTPVGMGEEGQFDIVLEVTGDLDTVLNRYERRATERRLPTYRREATLNGREFIALRAGGDSAEIFEATALVGRGKERTFLLLSLFPS